jgi:hypothetical protein
MALFFSASSRFRLALFSACMASNGPIMAEIIINIQYQGIASFLHSVFQTEKG